LAIAAIRLFHFLRRLADAVAKRNLGLISAGVAFFAFLAVFPAVAALIALVGFLADPAVIAPQMEILRDFLPDDAYRLLTAQVLRLVSVNDSTLGLTTAVSTLAALWSARRGVSALIQGLDAIHGADNRGGLRQTAIALTLTLVLIGVALVAILTMLISPLIFAFVPLGRYAALVLTATSWALALGVVVLGIALVYRFGPNRSRRTRWLSPGLVMAVFLWAAASVGFSQFLANFGNYNEVYGSIGAVIALLMWFYLSAWVVLFGAVLNAELEAPAEETPVDTA
jgi:membrane protein